MATADWLLRDGVLLFLSARTLRIALSVVRSGDPAPGETDSANRLHLQDLSHITRKSGRALPGNGRA
jgi:hypothetical protein